MLHGKRTWLSKADRHRVTTSSLSKINIGRSHVPVDTYRTLQHLDSTVRSTRSTHDFSDESIATRGVPVKDHGLIRFGDNLEEAIPFSM